MDFIIKIFPIRILRLLRRSCQPHQTAPTYFRGSRSVKPLHGGSSGTPSGVRGVWRRGYRWSFHLGVERPPATICQPFGLVHRRSGQPTGSPPRRDHARDREANSLFNFRFGVGKAEAWILLPMEFDGRNLLGWVLGQELDLRRQARWGHLNAMVS